MTHSRSSHTHTRYTTHGFELCQARKGARLAEESADTPHHSRLPAHPVTPDTHVRVAENPAFAGWGREKQL